LNAIENTENREAELDRISITEYLEGIRTTQTIKQLIQVAYLRSCSILDKARLAEV